MLRYAAIDIGSNAVRLLISDVIERNKLPVFKKKLFIRIPLRLGENAFTAHKISNEKMGELIKVIQAFKNFIEVYRVEKYMACATAALRESTNNVEVVEKVFKTTNIPIEIISGTREAEMIYTNHIAETLNHNQCYLYIDVGGGSTELTLFEKGDIIASNSFPLGTIRMLYNADSEESWESMKAWIKEVTAYSKQVYGIGTGGNINKIFKLAGKKEKKPVLYDEVKEVYNQLKPLSIEERIEQFGLNDDRADVIVPAAKIFLTIMKWSNINEIFVPRIGLADGILNYLHELSIKKTYSDRK